MDNFGSLDKATSYTSFSHDASTFPDTTTVSSGIVNDNELQGNHIVPTHTAIASLSLFYSLIFGNVYMKQDVIVNDIQETEQKTEEQRKRDHRNTLRRASYRRKKQYNVQVEHAQTLHLSGKLIMI